MTKPTAATAAVLLTLPFALDAGPLPRPQLSFEKNQGQTDRSVDFIARGRRYTATLHAGSYSMALRTGGGKLPRWTLSPLERFARPPATPWVISMYLVGANFEVAAEGLEAAFSNPRMSLKSVRAEKGRLQGEDLLSERIEGFERGGGQGGGGSCAHSCRDHEDFLELPLSPPLNVESGAVRPR